MLLPRKNSILHFERRLQHAGGTRHIPPTTRPKTVCLKSKWWALLNRMKNCTAALQLDTMSIRDSSQEEHLF